MSLLLALTGGGGGPVNYADTLSTGSYSVSGKTVVDSVVRADSLSVGAYVYSGKTVTDVLAKNDALTKGTYSIAGQSVTDSVVRADALSAGAYSIAGQNVTDVLTTGGGPVAYADNLNAGSYAISGKTVTDTKTVADSLSSGAYALAGQVISDAVARQDALAKGSYVYTGFDLTDVKTGAVAYLDTLQPGAYLITGQSITDEAPTSGTVEATNEVVLNRRFYVRRGKQIHLFNSAQEADDYLQAEQAIEAQVQAKTSRLARKRLREKLIIEVPAPIESVDVPELASMVEHFHMDVNLPSLIAQQDWERVMQIHALAMQLQDDEDVEMLLLA